MARSFYHYLMKYRNIEPKHEIEEFANHAYHDHTFPKLADDYHEISSYLEMHGDYIKSMKVFDRAWELYLLEER
ncbi:MAG TPA: YozE family protein [Bacillus sp. (in: firmicutes)]|uniref:YozE family protein n=1 Tax=Bacillus litorisediminis TaxID=2922713 RepID=UPI001FAC7437|nr:YozE family protein [Bacillus litorisediminis]HWO76286.1 YozE family protein [Bacillus sp. (in: firmicutes)]